MKGEVRGRGKSWKVLYEDESGTATPVQVFDREGEYKATIMVGEPTEKMVECFATFASRAEAEEHARAIGCDEVKATVTKATAPRKAKAPRNYNE